MTSRKALIIGAPDEKIPGVNVDIKNLKTYLSSPIGGLWYDNEIKTLTSPSAIEIRREIELLKVNDYSLIFFAGHGYHSIERKRTILHINSRETLDSLELRVGAQKHSLILDCCRKPESERRLLKSAMEAMTMDFAEGQRLNPSECRRFFDKVISDCDGGIVVMNSCSINETAGESGSEGGYYTSSLIDFANEWARKKLRTIDLAKSYATSSTQECHDAAAVQVKILSGGRQTPTFESPRAEKKFPFAVVA
jgi:hypothetical protein